MNIFMMGHGAAARFAWLMLAALLMSFCGAKAAEEETFALLQIGTQVYTNVTVTSKAKTYVFIVHMGGMTNIKVKDLPPDIREQLGYGGGDKPKAGTNSPAAWAKLGLAKLDIPQVKAVREKLNLKSGGTKPSWHLLAGLMRSKMLLGILGIMLVVYLFQCYCYMLICQKAGQRPGPLVWLPVLQFLPLLRAAGMSAWWFLGSLLPLLNLVTFILWSVNIVKARGKSGWVSVFLIAPPTSAFAILYLAFSEGGSGEQEDEREPQVMSLQAV